MKDHISATLQMQLLRFVAVQTFPQLLLKRFPACIYPSRLLCRPKIVVL